jgi:glutamyl-Q tRNA(Asp) synthetase
VKGDPVIFKDMIQGKIQQDITRDSGDFIVVRSDQVFSYNLVAAIDDAHGITHVIRGADLLDTTPKQVYLQNLLKISTPVYGHIPVAVNKDGKKLSKQHGAIDVLDE